MNSNFQNAHFLCFVSKCLFIVRRMQDKHRAMKKKIDMCFVDTEKAFESSKKGDEGAMRKNCLPERTCKSGDEPLSGSKDEN